MDLIVSSTLPSKVSPPRPGTGNLIFKSSIAARGWLFVICWENELASYPHKRKTKGERYAIPRYRAQGTTCEHNRKFELT